MEPKQSLLERAKPELLKAIAQYKVDYPNTASVVEDALKETEGVSFLQYGIICDMWSILNATKVKHSFTNPWELFYDRTK